MIKQLEKAKKESELQFAIFLLRILFFAIIYKKRFLYD